MEPFYGIFLSRLGPRLSGIVASFPVFAVVLTIFAHHNQGKEAARLVVRGLMMGLYGFACFFETISLLLARVPTAEAFGAALLAVTLVQGVSFALMRRRRPSAIARLGEEST